MNGAGNTMMTFSRPNASQIRKEVERSERAAPRKNEMKKKGEPVKIHKPARNLA